MISVRVVTRQHNIILLSLIAASMSAGLLGYAPDIKAAQEFMYKRKITNNRKDS